MKSLRWLGAVALLAMPAVAHAQVLTFEGIGDEAAVGNYYNGGLGGNLGITFSSNALAIISEQAGGSGNFGNQPNGFAPSGVTALFFLTGSAATMDVSGGFSTGFSFFYSAVNNPGVVNVWSGLDGTGTLLATLALPTTTNDGPGCSTNFCPFVAVGVSFSGTAMSVDFGGAQNQIAFDDITINSAQAGQAPGSTVPEPATMSMLAMGLVGMAGAARRRRKA